MFSSSFALVAIAIDDEETAWYDIDADGIIIMAMDDDGDDDDEDEGKEAVASAMVIIRLPWEDDGNMISFRWWCGMRRR